MRRARRAAELVAEVHPGGTGVRASREIIGSRRQASIHEAGKSNRVAPPIQIRARIDQTVTVIAGENALATPDGLRVRIR